MPNHPQSPTPEARPLGCKRCGHPAGYHADKLCSVFGCVCPAYVDAQSTPLEQRASEVWSALCPSCNKWSAQLICEYCGSDNTNKAIKFRPAHPEAVRMPIELPPLEDGWTNGDYYEFLCALGYEDEADCPFPTTLIEHIARKESIIRQRERQLLAALTDLQTERAAHERTRVELGRMKRMAAEGITEQDIAETMPRRGEIR